MNAFFIKREKEINILRFFCIPFFLFFILLSVFSSTVYAVDYTKIDLFSNCSNDLRGGLDECAGSKRWCSNDGVTYNKGDFPDSIVNTDNTREDGKIWCQDPISKPSNGTTFDCTRCKWNEAQRSCDSDITTATGGAVIDSNTNNFTKTGSVWNDGSADYASCKWDDIQNSSRPACSSKKDDGSDGVVDGIAYGVRETDIGIQKCSRLKISSVACTATVDPIEQTKACRKCNFILTSGTLEYDITDPGCLEDGNADPITVTYERKSGIVDCGPYKSLPRKQCAASCGTPNISSDATSFIAGQNNDGNNYGYTCENWSDCGGGQAKQKRKCTRAGYCSSAKEIIQERDCTAASVCEPGDDGKGTDGNAYYSCGAWNTSACRAETTKTQKTIRSCKRISKNCAGAGNFDTYDTATIESFEKKDCLACVEPEKDIGDEDSALNNNYTSTPIPYTDHYCGTWSSCLTAGNQSRTCVKKTAATCWGNGTATSLTASTGTKVTQNRSCGGACIEPNEGVERASSVDYNACIDWNESACQLKTTASQAVNVVWRTCSKKNLNCVGVDSLRQEKDCRQCAAVPTATSDSTDYSWDGDWSTCSLEPDGWKQKRTYRKKTGANCWGANGPADVYRDCVRPCIDSDYNITNRCDKVNVSDPDPKQNADGTKTGRKTTVKNIKSGVVLGTTVGVSTCNGTTPIETKTTTQCCIRNGFNCAYDSECPVEGKADGLTQVCTIVKCADISDGDAKNNIQDASPASKSCPSETGTSNNGSFPSRAVAGATLRYIGGTSSAWNADRFLYNSGTAIGIGIVAPSSILDINGAFTLRGTTLYNPPPTLVQDSGVGIIYFDGSLKKFRVSENGGNYVDLLGGGSGGSGTNGKNSLVKVSTENAGANCTAGGKKIESGIDDSGNGALEASEITATNYVCNGAAGSPGTAGTAGPAGATGPQGPQGLVGSAGASGKNALVAITSLTAGQEGCIAGGKKIDSGLDLNNSGALDSAPVNEITATNSVCNGTKGDTGTTGSTGPQGPAGPAGPAGAAGVSPFTFKAGTTDIYYSGGSLGIGTTDPKYKLDISPDQGGGMRIQGGTDTSWGSLFVGNKNNWSSSYYYPTVSSVKGSTGSLIMLENPHVPWRTDNAATGYGGRSGIRAQYEANGNWWDFGLAGDFFHIYKNGVGEFLRVTNTGNVGIGTTSPGVKLEISSSAVNTPIWIRNSSTGGDVWSVESIGNVAGRKGNFEINRPGIMNGLTITTAGNVGIGTTSPGAKLEVVSQNQDALRITGSETTRTWRFGFASDGNLITESAWDRWKIYLDDNNDSPDSFEVYHNGTAGGAPTQVFGTYDDKVGIGTTSPGAKLEVSGDIRSDVILTGQIATKDVVLFDRYPSFDGWSGPTVKTSTCGDWGMLGGYNILGANMTTGKTIPNLPAGEYVIEFDYYKIDSWDNEKGEMFWSGNGPAVDWEKQWNYSDGVQRCGNSSSNYLEDMAHGVVRVTHSGGDANFGFGSTLNEPSTNESFGVNNILVYKAEKALSLTGGSVNAVKELCLSGDCKTAWSQVGGSGANPVKNCSEIHRAQPTAGSGVYTIKPDGTTSLQVYCDMTTDGGGWTLVLLNSTYATAPAPNWNNAVNSNNIEGNINGGLDGGFDQFVGVKYWNSLGNQARMEIGANPTSINHRAYAMYYLDQARDYALSMAGLSVAINTGGIANPGLYDTHAAGKYPFSTYDADHDTNSGSCSSYYSNAPWWYESCWDGSFWGGGTNSGSGYQNKPFWRGSDRAGTNNNRGDWGAIWVRDNTIFNGSVGALGIGTTNPTARLDIQNGGSKTTGLSVISGYNADDKVVYFSGNPSVGYDFTMLQNGRVGIGNMVPQAKLHVRDDSASMLMLDRSSNAPEGGLTWADNGTVKWYMYQDNGTNDLKIQTPLQYKADHTGEEDARPRMMFPGNSTNILMALSGGNVGIGTTPGAKLDVNGNIYAGNSDIYFTKTDHSHTGTGNTAGYAAIENASDYNALMILGRSLDAKPNEAGHQCCNRVVKLWDYLQVNGNLDVTGEATASDFYIIRTTYTLPQDAGDKWIRIAKGTGNSYGDFRIIWESSSQHGNLKFTASCNYPYDNARCTINVQHWNEHALPGIKKIRVVRKSTYDEYYLEILVGNNNTTVNSLTIEAKDNRGFSIITPIDGATPAGYVTQEVKVENTRLSLGNGTLSISNTDNVGIGTTPVADKKLTVAGDINATGQLCIKGDCKTAWPIFTAPAETDPVFAKSVANGIATTDITNWNGKLSSYTETDPVFAKSVANGIATTDITNWNGKLSSYIETDPLALKLTGGTLTGNLEMNGGRIIAGNSANNGNTSGIWFWNKDDSNHAIYSANSSDGIRPKGSTEASTAGDAPDNILGTAGKEHRLRFRTATGQGWLFENNNNIGVIDFDSDDGSAYFGGNVGIGTTSPLGQLHSKGADSVMTTSQNAAGIGMFTGGGAGCPWCGQYWTSYSTAPGAGVGADSIWSSSAGPNRAGRAGGLFYGGSGTYIAGGGAAIFAQGGAGSYHGFGGVGVYARGGENGPAVAGGGVKYQAAGYFDGNLLSSGGLIVGSTYAPNALRGQINGPNGGLWSTVQVADGSAIFSGSVGIGTPTPGAKLDVAGTIQATGFKLSTAQTAGKLCSTDGSGNIKCDTPVPTFTEKDPLALKLTGGTLTGNLKIGKHYFDADDDGWLRIRDGDGGNYKDLAVNQFWANSTAYLRSDVRVGSSETENTIKFYGLTSDNPDKYDHTVIAERLFKFNNTTNDHSELLLFKGNDPDSCGTPLPHGSCGDRIRLDTPGSIVFQTGGGYRQYDSSYKEGNTAMVINSDGNVGIGTTNPGAKLEISGSGTYNTPNGNMKITNQGIMFGGPNTVGYEENSAQISAGTHVGNSLNIVGMGGTSAVRRIDTWNEGGFYMNGPLIGNNEIRTTSANAFRMAYGSYGSFFRNDGADTYLLLTNSGDPNGGWNNFRPFRINNNTGDVYLVGSSLFVRGSGSAQVGIGTTDPKARLHVDGSSRFDGSIWLNGSQTWDGDIAWSAYKNINIYGESSFDVYNGGVWGVWNIPRGEYFIKAVGKSGNSNLNLVPGGGRVGIGTDDPLTRLDVNGGEVNVSALDRALSVNDPKHKLALARDRIGLDVAELYETLEDVEVGDVLVASKTDRKLEKSSKGYQEQILGIVSGSPALVFEGSDLKLGSKPDRFTKGAKPPVALAGRVPVKVSLENGAIKSGDYLTSSSVPGVAMRATEPGNTVGVALENYSGWGDGTVLIFVNIGEKNTSSAIKELQKTNEDLQKRLEELEKKVR